MSPDEVPAELVDLGMRALGSWAKGRARVAQEADVRAVLAAVLPKYGATALEEEARTDRYDRPCEDRLLDAAERLRGTTTEGSGA